MPVHDWTRVEAGIFHDFHVGWIPEIRKTLNNGLLPEGYYAMAEQHAGRSVAIRHISGHRLVALTEIVSPADKDSARHVEEFAAKAVSALDGSVQLLLVDLFPPGPYDPHGMPGVIHQWLDQSDEVYDLSPGEPLTLASYAAGPQVEVYLELLAVGAAIPEMPLFLRPDHYINVPLETTYQEAYGGLPGFWREVLDRR